MLKNTNVIETKTVAVIALRGVIIFPGISSSFEIGRSMSVNALKYAQANDDEIFFVAQKDPSVAKPGFDDLNVYGVIGRIKYSVKLPNGNTQIMVDGIERAALISVEENNETMFANVKTGLSNDAVDDEDMKAAILQLRIVFKEFINLFPERPSHEIVDEVFRINNGGQLADYITSSFLLKTADRLTALSELNPLRRLVKVTEILQREVDYIELDNEIRSRVKHTLQRNQREAYLREQLQTIKNELGYSDYESDDDEYISAINKRKLPQAVAEKLTKEAIKLKSMPFASPESSVTKNYIETCLELPWNKTTKDRCNISIAEKILNEDHDGLAEVKERILEFMAVKQLTSTLKGQIICLVGPPGVGKTSIGRSIARATNRKYVRISLGGIRDEAEIRGHRKTYIGSMPGRIVTGIMQAGSINPVMLLDEIDKLTKDAHGDPTSALLEVLDGEQNFAFRDHFIELPFDLSQCLFIATANTTETIPAPLLDRMEIVYMDSYSDVEKYSIAKNHLIPKQIKSNGLNKRLLKFTDDGIRQIISGYTREAGVRNLEREIGSVCRKVAKLIISENVKSVVADADMVKKLLGAEKFLEEKIYERDETGVVNGLAWTSLGGDILRIEVLSMPGTGKLELTGYLGDVMKESARAAVSYIRKHAVALEVDPQFYQNTDLHIHVPEGAIPKDGPSAGITIACAIASELSNKKVRRDIAMTGEITLTGRVLPIGGLKEKTMAAYKAGVKTVIIPADNVKDLEKIDENVKAGIKFIPVSNVNDVLTEALLPAE